MTLLNLTDIEFPMTLKDISKFERLSINVYGIENRQVLPMRLIDDKKEKHINLLYLQDSHNDSIRYFAWRRTCLVRSQRNENRKYLRSVSIIRKVDKKKQYLRNSKKK